MMCCQTHWDAFSDQYLKEPWTNWWGAASGVGGVRTTSHHSPMQGGYDSACRCHSKQQCFGELLEKYEVASHGWFKANTQPLFAVTPSHTHAMLQGWPCQATRGRVPKVLVLDGTFRLRGAS